MARLLTSWKEIALHIGRSVRTVQRWEREAGLPVRRCRKLKGGILAVPDEIDMWVRAQNTSNGDQHESELAKLRNIVVALQAENEDLRHRLEAIQPRMPVRTDTKAKSPLDVGARIPGLDAQLSPKVDKSASE